MGKNIGQQTSDGGFIFIAHSVDADSTVLVKTDNNGDESWRKNFYHLFARSIHQTQDGGYIIGGQYDIAPKSVEWKPYILKTDCDGNKQWDRIFEVGKVGTCVREVDDGGYILTGYPNNFLIKIDGNGNIEWNKTYGKSQYGEPVVYQTTDHGYIMGAYIGSFPYILKLVKFDYNGTIEWFRTLEESVMEPTTGDLKQTEDGGYIVAAQKKGDIWLIKFGWSPPTADTGGPYYGNPEYPVSFDGTGSHDNDENGNSIVRYDWKFYDNDTWHNNITAEPTYNYTSVGNYTVTLRVWDDEGDNDTDTTTVYINYLPHPPTANAGGPYHVMEDDVLLLNATQSHDNDENGSSIVRYDWKFFDDDTWHNDIGATPSYTYSNPGEYTVTVRVHDDEGITDEDTSTVTVYGYYPPTADAGGPYYAMEEYGNEPDDPVHFDGSGSHDNDEHYFHNGTGYCIVNWTWDFGDGNTGYGKKVNHSYADKGTYTVTLIVTDNEGNTSNDTATAVIYGYYPPVAVPGGLYYGINSEPVQFDGSNSFDGDENGNSIVRYDWKFFDSDSWHNDIGPTPTHTYTVDGTYTVSLRVWDDEDPSSYNISNTTVTITHYNDPTADAGGPYTGKAYIPVTFDASASHDNDEGGCCITGYRWDWENDGVWDTGWLTTPTAQHTYLLGFTGNVRVQVKDDDGSHVGYDEDTAPVNIAGNPPTADFIIHSTNNPSIFKFDGSNSIDPRPGHNHKDLYYKWDFNNDGSWDKTGNWYTAGVVTWRYSTSGQKTIKLMVSNSDGSDTTTKTVTAFNYNDIKVTESNPSFFLSYPESNELPSLLNKYTFTTPPGVFTKVTFEIGGVVKTDEEGDTWSAELPMNKGVPDENVVIKGYKDNEVVWTKNVPTFIIGTADWFIQFLENSVVTVNQPSDYSSWEMRVHSASMGLSFKDPDVKLLEDQHSNFDGPYEFKANVNLPDDFSIKSEKPRPYTINLYHAGAGLDIHLAGKKPKVRTLGWSGHVGAGASIDADLEVTNDAVLVLGWFNVYGKWGISVSYPIFEIIIAGVWLEGGVDVEIAHSLRIFGLGPDGYSFNSKDFMKCSMDVYGYGAIDGHLLLGVAGAKGGLYFDGGFSIMIPSYVVRSHLEGGAFLELYSLWGMGPSKRWNWPIYRDGVWFPEDRGEYNRESFPVRYWESRNMDVLCLKDNDDYGSRGMGNRDVTVLATNVGPQSVPKIVLTNNNYGVTVWSDISLTDNDSAVQSDIYWSVYDGGGWGPVESTNTTNLCEFDPEVTVVNNSGEEYVVLTYLAVDKTINETTDVSTFYAEPRVHTAVWNSDTGWSFRGDNLLIFGGTVNSRSMSVDNSGNIFMSYLLDTDCDPWENGIGKLFAVNGSVVESDTGLKVDWGSPVLIKEFDDIALSLQPRCSFINHSIGGVIYPKLNATSNNTDIYLIPTVSGVNGFNSTYIVDSSNESISSLWSIVDGDNIVLFWIKNNSVIYQSIIEPNQSIENWSISEPVMIFSNQSLVYLKPVFCNDKHFLLFQKGNEFIPYVIEEQMNSSWGNLRTISLEGPYSFGMIDGESNNVMSQMVYVGDTPLTDWLVGRWRFNDGNGIMVSDDSGFGNDGVVVGSPTWVNHTNETLDLFYGFYLCFNGSDNHVTVPYNNSLVVDDEFTTTCWIRLNQTTSGDSNNIIGTDGSWQLYEENGSLGVRLWRTNGLINVSDIAVLPLGSWTFIGITYNHGMLRVIVRPNGLNNTTATYNLGDYSIVDSGNPLIIGGFVGCVDEVWLFNRDISMSEVDSIWFTPYPTLGSIHDIVVQHLPSFASFNLTIGGRGNYTNITTEDIITFTGYPSGFIFEWDFGDGTYTLGQNVSHQYDTAGFYTIICNATDPSTGAVTPIIQQIYVSDVTPPTFAGLQSIVNGSNNITLSWNPANDTSPFITYYGFMSNQSGVYNFSSPYFVTENTSYVVDDLEANKTYYFIMRAFDASGNSDNNTVELSGTPFDNTSPVFNGLTGAYKIDNYNGSVLLEWNDAVDISEPIIYNIYISTVCGIYNFSNPIGSTNLTWYIVDGLNESTYYFVVHAIDVYGNEDDNMVEMNISFNIPPFANFAFMPTYPTAIDIVTFIDLSIDIDGYIVNWTWNFGDGNISYEPNPSHQYANVGTYNVTLTVRDDDGATTSITKQIIVVSIDYILVTHKNKNEMQNYNISTNLSFNAYASAFNYTYGFIEFVDANWSILNYGTNATINATQGKSILFNSGMNDGTAILQAEYNGYTDSVVFTISSSLFSFILYKGWNLITLPCKNSYNASSLFNDIEGCSIILSWNASLQDFMLYAPGTPYDFVIEDGHGYFVGMNHDSIFSLVDSPIQSVNVTLYIGWNMLGWFKENETNTSSLYNAIENCSIILSWNASLQNFELYVPGTPDFVIKQGDGFLVAVDKQSIWHGEG